MLGSQKLLRPLRCLRFSLSWPHLINLDNVAIVAERASLP